MKKYLASVVILIVVIIGVTYAIYDTPAPEPVPSNDAETMSVIYSSSAIGFSVTLPGVVASTSDEYSDSYKVDETYVYQASPAKVIPGVKFTIPENMATGTNLSRDSYVSVESLPVSGQSCKANIFLDGTHDIVEENQNDISYSVASSSGAGAGNRYDETVYAIGGTDPCIAVRYFLHYTVVQNYPEGTVREFDRDALVKEFDSIRKSLVLKETK
ncbi:MAG: hypothetical protein WCV79_03485 [Candidatus Paceibacterota bacterium]|jgi:hypothetical protein